MNPYSVLIKPLLTEKSSLVRDNDGKYSFLVKTDASKFDIKKAVEVLFGVQVKSVNTNITRGKMKRRGMSVSLTPKKKKAIVQLAEGQKLKIFEDQ